MEYIYDPYNNIHLDLPNKFFFEFELGITPLKFDNTGKNYLYLGIRKPIINQNINKTYRWWIDSSNEYSTNVKVDYSKKFDFFLGIQYLYTFVEGSIGWSDYYKESQWVSHSKFEKDLYSMNFEITWSVSAGIKFQY